MSCRRHNLYLVRHRGLPSGQVSFHIRQFSFGSERCIGKIFQCFEVFRLCIGTAFSHIAFSTVLQSLSQRIAQLPEVFSRDVLHTQRLSGSSNRQRVIVRGNDRNNEGMLL